MFGAITQGIVPYILAALGIVVVLFSIYFFWSQAKIEKQAKDILAYEITVQSQQDALIQLGADVETIKDINKELSTIERDSAENAAKLADTLRGLETVAKEKPVIVERLVNDSARNRVRCFELATGAQPLEDEVNTTCPHLLRDR